MSCAMCCEVNVKVTSFGPAPAAHKVSTVEGSTQPGNCCPTYRSALASYPASNMHWTYRVDRCPQLVTNSLVCFSWGAEVEPCSTLVCRDRQTGCCCSSVTGYHHLSFQHNIDVVDVFLQQLHAWPTAAYTVSLAQACHKPGVCAQLYHSSRQLLGSLGEQ